MILTNQKKFHDRILDLTHFDQRKDYKIRYNYYLSDLSAAVGLNQFRKLPAMIHRRRKIATRYLEALRFSPFYNWEGKEGGRPNYYRFLIGCLKPYDFLVKQFAKHKIQVISPLEPYQLLHRYLGRNKKDYPAAEAIARTVISLPIYPAMTDLEVKKVCQTLKDIRL